MYAIIYFVAIYITIFTSFAYTQPDAQVYYDKGLKELKSKDYIKAIGEFTNALSVRANYAEAYLERGKAKIMLGIEMGFENSEACFDLVTALRYGNLQALPLLEKHCMGECFDTKMAFTEPDMVLCADFSNKVLSEIPAKSAELSNAIKLNVFNNKITQLGDNVAQMLNLVHIDASSNAIALVNPSISRLTYLKELNLNKNKISQLPYEFGNLENLQLLYLRSNYLNEMPKSIARLKNLEVLDLSLNKLTSLPIEIANLKKLRILNLVGNDIPKEKQDIIIKLLPNTKVYFE